MGTKVIFVVLAALCWGLSGGIGGILMTDGWGAFVVSFYRGGIGLVFVLAWLVLRPQRSGLANLRLWLWAALAGLGVAGNFAFYFISIAEGSVAVAATLMYSAPIFVSLISFALKLEKPTPAKGVAIALVMTGIVLLTRIYALDSEGVTPLALAAGIFSGVSYALFIFAFKNAAPHGSPQAILVLAFAVLSGILFWPAEGVQILAVPAAPAWPLFVILGVLGAGLSFILYIIGLKQTSPVTASVVAMVEPVTASLFGILVLGEKLAAGQFFGMGLILATVTAMSISSSTTQPGCTDSGK